MTQFPEEDVKKINYAIRCIQKTLRCTLCHKLPTETKAAKCGHPFCKTCVEKVLDTKKAVCSICKTVIIRSAIRDIQSIDKIIEDFHSLCEAVEKDSNTNISLDNLQGRKQYSRRHGSLALPGPLVDKLDGEDNSKTESSIGRSVDKIDKIDQEDNFRTDSSIVISDKQRNGRRTRAAKIGRQKSIASEETIKIPVKKVANGSNKLLSGEPSTSRATNKTSEPVFTADDLSNKIGIIGYKEKVEDWLNSEQFEEQTSRAEKAFLDIAERSGSNSPSISEVLESFSQTRLNSGESSTNGRNSRASKTLAKTDYGSMSTVDNKTKFKSFTSDATNRRRRTIPEASTPAEQMFDDLCRKSIDDSKLENEKSKAKAVSTESSWTELARLKKETKPKVRKRKRLNISIERPNSTKPVVESLSLDREESEDEKTVEDTSMVHEKSKESGSNKEVSAEESPRKRLKPNLLSYRTLKQSEMIDVQKLNKRQVREIIGYPNTEPNLDSSKNSTNSPDKSPAKSVKYKPSLRRSGERSREINNKEEASSHFDKSSRPQSKQSIHENDTRPGSRLSYESGGNPTTKKFRLSTGRKSATPNNSPIKIATDLEADQLKEEEERIQLGKDSPVRVCSESVKNKLSLKRSSSGSSKDSPVQVCRESVKNKLSLKRSSSGSSKMTDHESKSSSVISIKKLEELYRPLKKLLVTTRDAGTQTSEPEGKESRITTRSIETQTEATITSSDSTSIDVDVKYPSSKSMPRSIIPGTRTTSTVSNQSRRIQETRSPSKTIMLDDTQKEFDTITKVNMLSPEKDSQLKYLSTESPSVSKITRNVKETRRTDSSVVTPKPEEYLRAVKKYADNLIATDSEDQDTPNESLGRIRRRINHEAMKNRSPKKAVVSGTTSSISQTVSGLSEMRTDDGIEATANQSVVHVDESPSVKSAGNNSEGKLSHGSPKRRKPSKDVIGSQTKRRSTDKPESLHTKTSGSFQENTSVSEAETVLPNKTKSGNGTQGFEGSETSVIPARHKVVRKLKYTQESGRSGSSKQQSDTENKKSDRVPEKKAFQRIRRVPSSDSEDEFLEISSHITTEQSSSNSQTLARPRPSQFQQANKSPILSEDMTVVFSSNKDTQESKRKRSPSPNSLDNNDLQAIASNWCADLDHFSEEIAVGNNKLLGHDKNRPSDGIPPKKPRVDARASPASSGSFTFPALSPTAIYGDRGKGNDPMETAAKMNDQSESLNTEESALLYDLDEAARQFDEIEAKPQLERNGRSLKETNSVPVNNTKHITLAADTECSIKRGTTFSGIMIKSRSSQPIKAKSLEDSNLPSLNSDKENELEKRVVQRKEIERALKMEKRSEALDNSRGTQAGYVPKSNGKSVPVETNSKNSTEPLESSFDRDCLNITQEQELMQELENNLLGRRPKNTTEKMNSAESRRERGTERTPKKIAKGNVKEPGAIGVHQKVKGYQIAQIDTDDSGTMDEDIIDCTPEKDTSSKKDLYCFTNNSQRSNASLKSFMSVNMTPIPKAKRKDLQTVSDISLLLEPTSKTLAKKHSTPKPLISSLMRKTNVSETVQNEEERRLCFVCSCLTLPQVQNVRAFARKHNVEYTANYKPEVTHVIVETNESDSAGRTLKYLLGVAHKKWIVSYRWVTDSMKQNRILEEEDYEAVDSDTEEPGPRRSRLSKKGLFDDFAFVCMKPFTDITIEQLQDLLSSTGGTIVKTLEDIASVTNKHKVILYSTDIHEPAVLDTWRQKGRALPVQVEWVLSCISQYELVSFRYYLQVFDPEVLSDFGFPPELIVDEEDDSSLNEANELSNA